MKKTISSIVTAAFFFSSLSMGIPQLAEKVSAATTYVQNHTFETNDPNFGALADGAAVTSNDYHIGFDDGLTGTIKNSSGNRYMEVAIPADNAKGLTSFLFHDWGTPQTTGNCYTFEGTVTFADASREYDLQGITGDWSGFPTFIAFTPDGKVKVNNVARGTWSANKKYTLKFVLYKDIKKYDFFITDAGNTTMLGSRETLPAADAIISSGLFSFGINASKGAAASHIDFDDVKLAYSEDVRDAYTAPADAQVIRTTTFETNDTDSTIAGTPVDTEFKANILDSKSPSTMKIVNNNGSRWLEAITAKDSPGDVGYPTDPSWGDGSLKDTYIVEADYMLKDQNADYYVKAENWWGFKPDILLISKDGNIYGRSKADGTVGMTARTTWSVNQPFTLKLIVHRDTQSYDLYHTAGGVSTRLVTNEPLQAGTWEYDPGFAGFFVYVKSGAHEASTIMMDNMKLSVSDAKGTAPIINANPGDPFIETVAIGDPISYYVSPTGDDANDGKSPAKPFKSIQKAANLTLPGDTVYLMDGEWKYSGGDRFLKIENSGAFDKAKGKPAYITYKAYEGAHPVIFSDNAWDIISVKASYIIIDGITVRGNNQNLTLADGEAAYNYVNGNSNVDWTNPLITKVNTNGISVDGRGRVAAGLKPIHDIIVRNCTVHDVSAGGISANEADYVTVENNNVYNNCWYMMFAGSGISIFHTQDFDSNTTTYKNVVRNNIVHDNETRVKWIDVKRYSDGNGIIVDDNKNTQINLPAYKGKTLVTNNISYNNGGSGIHAFSCANVDIINNTLYNNNLSLHLNYQQIFASDSEYCNVFNNIVYSRALRPGEKSYTIDSANGSDFTIFANNIYYGGGTPGVVGPNDVVADPQFVSIDPAKLDFHLKSTSPAVDRATKTLAPATDLEGNARPRGAKFDIGAYESSYTSTTPIANDVIDIAGLRKAMEFKPEEGKAVKAVQAPVIDGKIDSSWQNAPVLKTTKVIGDGNSPFAGATAEVRVQWDASHLYVLADVTDKSLEKSNTNPWEQDSVEIFVDQNNHKTATHETDDRQYRINYVNEKTVGTYGSVDEITSSTSKTDKGYLVEVAIPLTAVTPADGAVIGFDLQVNDDDGSGHRTGMSLWSDPKSSGWSNTSKFGNLTLVNEIPGQAALQAAINDATSVANNPANAEGMKDGQIVPGSKAIFEEAIAKAQAVFGNGNRTQAQADTAIDDLAAAKSIFLASKELLTKAVLSMDNIAVTVSKTGVLKVTGKDQNDATMDLSNAAFEYVSSNPEVASIKDGSVIGNKVGTAQIYVKITVNGREIKSNTINVSITSSLPKTGTFIDMTALIFLGLILALSGVFLLVYDKKKSRFRTCQ